MKRHGSLEPSRAEPTPAGPDPAQPKGTGGAKPAVSSTVKVAYTGWTPDGHMFDSSAQHGGTATFGVTGVIKGWTEGLQLMTKGERARFWIPPSLAYGEDAGGGAPSGMLVFDIELVDFQ